MNSLLAFLTEAGRWLGRSFNDISTNLIAAAIGGAVLWLGSLARRRAMQFRAQRFWRHVTDHDPVIAVGIQDPTSRGWDRAGLVGSGDVAALLRIHEGLRALGTDARVVVADALSADAWGGNLILIGGPDANQLTAEMMARIDESLSFVFPKWQQHYVFLMDKVTRRMIGPDHSADGKVVKVDYGLIVRTQNPLGTNDTEIIILAGCWGYGTEAAAKMLATKTFYRHPLVRSKRPFEILIRTTIAGDVPQAVQLVEARSLDAYQAEKQAWSAGAKDEVLEELFGSKDSRMARILSRRIISRRGDVHGE